MKQIPVKIGDILYLENGSIIEIISDSEIQDNVNNLLTLKKQELVIIKRMEKALEHGNNSEYKLLLSSLTGLKYTISMYNK
jgi:hypothetical protein